MALERFDFAFAPRALPVLAAFGVRPSNSVVLLDDEHLDARCGPVRVRTHVTNLRSVQITRDYRWVRVIGIRMSLKDRGVSFGTNTRAGVCVCFHEPVTALLWGRVRHPALTVTVADVDGFAAAVEARLRS